MVTRAQQSLTQDVCSSPWVRDRDALPPIADVGEAEACGVLPQKVSSGARALYVDNSAAIGLSQRDANDQLQGMLAVLAEAGMHSEADPEEVQGLIGFTLSNCGHFWRPASGQLSCFCAALDHVLGATFVCSGREMEVLAGHIVHMLSLRKDLLGIPSIIHSFIRRFYDQRVRLWLSLRREVDWVRQLLPLAFSHISRSWYSEAYMYDASLSGYGIARARPDFQHLVSVGSMQELFRFRGFHKSYVAPRLRAVASGAHDGTPADLALDGMLETMSSAEANNFGEESNLPELTGEFLNPGNWAAVFAGR